MKKLALVAAMAIFSTAAMADDFDNTSVKLTAQGENYSVSVKSPKTGATEFELGTEVKGVELKGKWLRNGSTDDYAIEVEKQYPVATTPVYVGAKAEFSFGDSYTSSTRTLVATPYVGIAQSFGKLTPFAEVGYSFKSLSDDIVDFSKNDSVIKVGASYELTNKTALKLTVQENRDVDFKNPGDRQAEVAFTVKF